MKFVPWRRESPPTCANWVCITLVEATAAAWQSRSALLAAYPIKTIRPRLRSKRRTTICNHYNRPRKPVTAPARSTYSGCRRQVLFQRLRFLGLRSYHHDHSERRMVEEVQFAATHQALNVQIVAGRQRDFLQAAADRA